MVVRSDADVSFFLVGGYDVLGTLTSVRDKMEALTEESHTLGDSWVENLYTGIRKSEINQEGFYDDAANSVHEQLQSGLTLSRVLCYGLEGTATGAQFIGYAGALQISYEKVLTRGALHKARADYRPAGRVDTGRLLRPQNPTTASGVAGSPIDNTVSSTNGGAGYLQLVSFASAALATGLQVAVQHSSDNITYANLATFTSVTATTPTAERIANAAGVVVERYLRANSSFIGGAAGASAIYMVGYARY